MKTNTISSLDSPIVENIPFMGKARLKCIPPEGGKPIDYFNF